MNGLAELELTVGDIDFGGIDAESDAGLDDYFVTTPHVRHLLSGSRTQFLGRKGSGKSALFRQIGRLAQLNGDRSSIVKNITPNQYAWSMLGQYREQGLSTEQAHTNAWKFTLLVEVVSEVVCLDRSWGEEARKSITILRKFLRDNFGEVDTDLKDSARSILKGIGTFNVSAFGFGVGASLSPAQSDLTPAIIEKLTSLLEKVVYEQNVVIALDRLDDSWDGSDDAKSLLIGLLKAAKDFNDLMAPRRNRIPGSPKCGLRVLVFLRSDIYDVLAFEDKDKHRQLEEHITWTPELLKEMAEQRIPEGISLDKCFEEDSMRGSISPFNYIVKRTFLRPREVLQFLMEVQREEEPESLYFSKEAIKSAEERYSKWKVEDLKQEFAKAFPDFAKLIECLRQQVHRYDSLEELADVLKRQNGELVEKYGTRFLLEKLFDYSVIGVRIANQGATRFKAEDSDIVLPLTGAAYVHQSLYKGLGIRETRKSR